MSYQDAPGRRAEGKAAARFCCLQPAGRDAGNGGNGCVAFRREKYVPRGGHSGGDGGNGGSIYLQANLNDNTLLRYRYNREFKADRGRHGEGSNCTGYSGEDVILKAPVGTLAFDDQTGETIADLATSGQ